MILLAGPCAVANRTFVQWQFLTHGFGRWHQDLGLDFLAAPTRQILIIASRQQLLAPEHDPTIKRRTQASELSRHVYHCWFAIIIHNQKRRRVRRESEGGGRGRGALSKNWGPNICPYGLCPSPSWVNTLNMNTDETTKSCTRLQPHAFAKSQPSVYLLVEETYTKSKVAGHFFWFLERMEKQNVVKFGGVWGWLRNG